MICSWKHKFNKSSPKPFFIIFIEKQRWTADFTNVLLISHLVSILKFSIFHWIMIAIVNQKNLIESQGSLAPLVLELSRGWRRMILVTSLKCWWQTMFLYILKPPLKMSPTSMNGSITALGCPHKSIVGSDGRKPCKKWNANKIKVI